VVEKIIGEEFVAAISADALHPNFCGLRTNGRFD
jgi:hypothetical protein